MGRNCADAGAVFGVYLWVRERESVRQTDRVCAYET